jgi:hypothetical protein
MAAMAAICVLEATRAGAQNPAMISPRSSKFFPANLPRPSLRTPRPIAAATCALRRVGSVLSATAGNPLQTSDRMELGVVARVPGLPVREIEDADPADPHNRSELLPRVGRYAAARLEQMADGDDRSTVARRRGETAGRGHLRDQVVAVVKQHQVDVLVGFELVLDDLGGHAPHPTLICSPRQGQNGWWSQAIDRGHRCCSGPEVDEVALRVAERLLRPRL